MQFKNCLYTLYLAVVIDITAKVEQDGASANLSSNDVTDWIKNHGMFPNNSIILIRTGWSKYFKYNFYS